MLFALTLVLPAPVFALDNPDTGAITFNEASYRTLSSRTVRAKKFKINLRTMIKEGNNGYSVVQGGCTDGTYAYYLMVSTKTQKGRMPSSG